VSDHIHAPGNLPWGKRPRYALDRRLGGPQSRSGTVEERKMFCTCQESNPSSSAIQPIPWPNTILTELSRLQYLECCFKSIIIIIILSNLWFYSIQSLGYERCISYTHNTNNWRVRIITQCSGIPYNHVLMFCGFRSAIIGCGHHIYPLHSSRKCGFPYNLGHLQRIFGKRTGSFKLCIIRLTSVNNFCCVLHCI
jgi:hypothetical protein